MPRFGRPPIRRIRPPIGPARRRPFGPRTPLAPGPIRTLAQANQLFQAGQFVPAAEKFEMLAHAARASNIPVAPRLFFQAARANWHAGNIPHGMDLLRIGLDLFVAAGAVRAIRQITPAAMNELQNLGHAQEAESLKGYLDRIPGGEATIAAASEGKAEPAPVEEPRPTLPTHCGQCGAIIRSDEVEWIDRQTAECVYCGSPIRPEKA
jgi:hypothetical protein